MLARCVATLKPPPELTLSQWADRYRMLSAESSAEPGRWHTDKAPYQREIMDAIGDAHIRRVVIMCAAQLGKTELLLNILGYFMAYAPAPILVMQPTLDMGQTFSKDRLAPMIRDTPVLRGLVDVKSRYAGNTILKKNFPGGHITIVGANSATGLASRPIKVLLADEVDRYPGSAGTEGDPLSLAQKRQTTFWDKKTVMVSTPVIKGHSRIETEYNQSTREEWNVPCPECGQYLDDWTNPEAPETKPLVPENKVVLIASHPDYMMAYGACTYIEDSTQQWVTAQTNRLLRSFIKHLQRRYWRGGNTVRTYKHLTMTDRLRIEKWLKMGMKPREIADKLRVHVSTIYRELKRGAYDRLDGATWEVKTTYSPDIAEDKYQAHLREKGPDLKIGNDHELANYIETTIINKDCSPAAVLGFAMIEGKKFKTSLSVPTIYKYIAKGLFLNLTQEELPRHGKKKHKYKKVKKNKSASRAPAGESIEQRPEEIDEREEFGHWEGDTVYSGRGKRKTTRALLTLTERKTRKEIIIAIPNRKAETVVKALDALERKLGARRFRAIFKSITFDNGTEFAAAEGLERSCVNKRLPRTKVYFCHPYSSWERGTNENTNGMIRRRFPKGTNFAAVTNAQIAQAENWINNYPRKILGYKSSEIVFRECLRELGIAA